MEHLSTKKRTVKRELYEREFSRRYVKNGLNGRKTTLELKPYLKEGAADVESYRMVRRPSVRREIEAILEQKNLTDSVVVVEHKKLILQDGHLPSKNAAIDTYYKIKGHYKPQEHHTLNLNIDVNDPEAVARRIAEIQGELALLG